MANELTGEFDVVAEFAIPAANRLLAAMHRAERLLHSLAVRVDDTRRPGPLGDLPTVVGILDAVGDPVSDPTRIGSVLVTAEWTIVTDPDHSLQDSVVNTNIVDATVAPIVPTQLQGRAQLQLSPPKLEVPDGSGINLRARLQVMLRYLADPNTSGLAEFLLGELQVTGPVKQNPSQMANTVDFDISANTVSVIFTPTWSSRPLSDEDRAGINQAIRNALKTGFQRPSITLPSDIRFMQFKTLLGGPAALAVLLNLPPPDVAGAPGNPASMNNVFLGVGDDFAVAAGRDYLLAEISRIFSSQLHQPFPVEFNVDWVVYTQHVSYTVVLNSLQADLQDDKIVVTIEGHAQSHEWNFPSFGFTAKQALKLKLVATTAGGPLNTAELLADGDIDLEPHGSIVADVFEGYAESRMGQMRDQVIAQAQPTVRQMLHADAKFGGFLKSLLNPPGRNDLQAGLAYTSVKIRSSGIVLHGSLTVPSWPAAHVEFEQIPATGTGPLPPFGPDYSALKTWIPGGTIRRFEWSFQGQPPFHIDDHKFVLRLSAPDLSTGEFQARTVFGFTPMCLTVRGVRLSSSGPVVEQPVSATACSYTWTSVIPSVDLAQLRAAPLVALTQPGPRGLVEVTGHTLARANETGRGSPNVIVHFADARSAGRLEVLTQALRESRRDDAATAVLAVLTPEQLANARHTEGVIYAEEDGAWARAFKVSTTRRPLTLIAEPGGNVVWQHEGELDSAALAGSLRQHLVRVRAVRMGMLGSSVRIGQRPPNFLFPHAPGRELTLRKLVGLEAIVGFWRSSLRPSLEAVRDLQRTTARTDGQGPIVLAINDGDPVELAHRVAAENGLSGVVADPERRISLAYGVDIWPMFVFIDARGLVTEIGYGRPARGSAR